MEPQGNRYAMLREELGRLEGHFRQAALASPGLRCQRVWDGDPVTATGWDRFARANPLPGMWQQTHVLAAGDGLLRFFGSPGAIDPFTSLADSGWLLLSHLRLSPEAEVDLGNSSHADGWAEAVFETALATMTPSLRVECDRWMLAEEDLDDLNELAPSYWSDGGPDRYPVHPCIQTLALDVFASSAEAIRLWLDPAACLTVDARLDDGLPIRLPGPEPATSTPSPSKLALNPDDELDTRAAAAFLGVSPDTLERYYHQGILPRRNIAPPSSGKPRYRYKVADLIKMRQQGYRKAAPKPEPAPRRRKAKPQAKPTYDHLDLD